MTVWLCRVGEVNYGYNVVQVVDSKKKAEEWLLGEATYQAVRHELKWANDHEFERDRIRWYIHEVEVE